MNLHADLMNVKVEIQTEEQRIRPQKSEVERLWADNRKACQILKWHPEFAGNDGFRKGLEKTIEWFSKPENNSKYKSDLYIL